MQLARKATIGIFAVGAIVMALLTGAYGANPLIENAKNQCVIGEQADGYLGVVSGQTVSDALRREIRDINQRRKSYYADIARRNGVTVEVTGQLAAQKLIEQASIGQCVRNE